MTEPKVGDTDGEENGGAGAEPSFFTDPRAIAITVGVVFALIAAIYIFVPKLVGIQNAVGRLEDGNPVWIAIAIGFEVLSFVAYIVLFKGVVAHHLEHLDWRATYHIALAGLTATLLFSAAGAGGIVLQYWALRKAGMERRESGCRMVAFYVLEYGVYMISLVVFGVLLWTGVLSGSAPAGLTIVPAGIAGALIALFLLMALLPEDFERRIEHFAGGYRRARIARRLGTVPATLASGTRTALEYVKNPAQGWIAIAGAVGYWSCNIGIMWAAFHAFDVSAPLGVVVMGFFVGTAANLTPFAPAGVGALDAGLIGTFVLFGLPSSSVFAAVLTYRLIAYWLPIPLGLVAFFQLRRTVARWDAEGHTAGAGRRAVPVSGATAITSESKV